MKMFRTNDPIADFNRWDSEREAALEKLPICSECGRRINEDTYFDIEGEYYHVKCFEKEHLKWTEDFIG